MPRKKRLINREISWLAFNQRVLDEAADKSVPIMERLKFLGIFSNNRDEFFRVRVASVKRLIVLNEKMEASKDDPKEVFTKIQEITIAQQRRYEGIYAEILATLRENSVYIVNETELTKPQKAFVKDYYQDEVDPIIGPIMLDQLNEFPQLSDEGIYLSCILYLNHGRKRQEEKYALMEVPASLPRFVEIPSEIGNKVIMIQDDILRHNLEEVFDIFKPDKVDAYTFKITCNAQLDLDNDISKSFLEKMKQSLNKRRLGEPLRFVYDAAMPSELKNFLTKKMDLQNNEDAFIPGGRYHNLKDLMGFPKLNISRGYYRPLSTSIHPAFKKIESYLEVIKKKDVMLHFPFQSFNHIIEVLKEAALDPKVKSIKICLYRVSKGSKVINALINAARNGKNVVVVIELRARFDEENNIYWSRILEDEGVKVLFGFPGLKVHSKVLLVTRKEVGVLNEYVNIGTGNFNESTAKAYTDVSLLTSDKRITAEVSRLFDNFENAIWSNYSFKHILLSPFYLRNKLVRMINTEIRNAKAGKPAFIRLKINSLVDPNLIDKLYEASNAGVKIDMVIRGICSLIPGVKDMSENINVVSIIDRYLEHSRIYVFSNGGDSKYYISSADWMVRNIDRRIEVTCPIYAADIKSEIDDIFSIQLSDNVKGHTIHDGINYKILKPTSGEKKVRSQYELNVYYRQKAKAK